MYAKTEIYYMMRDKVIPSLLNSEKNINHQDIKEVFRKSSYWKNDIYEYPEKNSLNKKTNKLTKKAKNHLNINSLKHKSYSHLIKNKENKNYINLTKTENHIIKGRNVTQNNFYKNSSNKYTQTSPSIFFTNPILKSISYEITSKTNSKNKFYTLSLQKSRSKKAKKIFIPKKNKPSYRNNSLRNIKSDFEYKIFYIYKNDKKRGIKSKNNIFKENEENNHLILRGLALNKEQKYYYSKCRLTHYDVKPKKRNINKIDEENINKEKINKNQIYDKINEKKSNNNLFYSLKGLLNYKYPIKIKI